MKRWRRICGVFMILLGYCVQGWTAEFTPVDSEEVEVRAIMELALEDQQLLEKSGILYRNEVLESYINLVAARLNGNAAAPGGGFRVKMIKDPHLNAFTYPDGTCYIQTGILARLENEAELAALLAHELAHYTSSHAVNGIRRFHRHSENDLSSSALNQEGNESYAQIRRRIECAWSGYHHEAEFEADREGLKFMISAGYDPYAVLRLFGHLAEEMSRENLQEPLTLGSHPRLKARIEKCNEFLANLNPEHRNKNIKEGNFEEHIQDLLLENISLDIQAGRFTQALQASKRYLSVRSDDARAHYLLGEIYRQQGQAKTEVTRAESCYKRAIDLDDEYAEPHRALGILYYKTGLSQQARPYLEASLVLAPKAPENAYIRNYLSRIQP